MKMFRPALISLACLLWAGCDVRVQEPGTDPAPAPDSGGTPPGPEPLSAMQGSPIPITVNPSLTRKIGGITDLDRRVYFSIADRGARLDERTVSPGIYELLTQELRVAFGRELGPVNAVTRWTDAVREDPKRKGFVDLDYLRSELEQQRKMPSAMMMEDYGPNLHVAAHGHPKAYPTFMGEYTTEEVKSYNSDQALPTNLLASAEYAAAVFQYRYNDFDRPPFFEPINEPHWSFDDAVLADWHLAMLKAFRKARLPVKVGGPCMSVAYLFRNNYKTWQRFARFMDATGGEMDFYSFHSYDFFEWREGKFVGRVQTGLPIEGTLDLIPNYGLIQFDREMPMVISEHGGYLLGQSGPSPEELQEQLATRFFPGEGFDWTMEQRSILSRQHVRSIINNTLAFMDHPHTVQKAVPFILLESFSWDPEYYASLYVPRNFTNRNDWVASANMDFYRLFRDLEGRRVVVHQADPDLQAQAFVSGDTLRVVINNLHREGAPLQLALPGASSYTLRRYGQYSDFRPYLTESAIPDLENLVIRPFETLLLSARYPGPIREKGVVNETMHYGTRVAVEVQPGSTERIQVPLRHEGKVTYAELRLGFRRPAGTDHRLDVSLNGMPLDLSVEDHADRLEDEKDYASMRKVRINPKWIQTRNTVTVSFPDGKPGTVGSVVLRTAM